MGVCKQLTYVLLASLRLGHSGRGGQLREQGRFLLDLRVLRRAATEVLVRERVVFPEIRSATLSLGGTAAAVGRRLL